MREVCLTKHGGETLNILHPSLQSGLDPIIISSERSFGRENKFLFVHIIITKEDALWKLLAAMTQAEVHGHV